MANDFLPFSTGGGANVYTNAEYVADTDHTNGNQPGIAKSKLVNKALRQCSIISTVVAQYIADIVGTNAVDDGTTATLLADMKTATSVSYNTHVATSKTTPVDADEIPLIDSSAAFGLKKLTWLNIKNTLFTSIPSGNNLLINSNGLVNQREYVSGTATTLSNQYTLDMFRVVTSGQNLTFSTTVGVTTFTAPAGGVDLPIENKNIIGGNYVLSFTGTATEVVSQSVDNVTYADVTPVSGVYTITGGYYVRIRFSGGTFSNPKFEEGVIASPYSLSCFSEELNACERYYETSQITTVFYGTASMGWQQSVPHGTKKRVSPSVTITTPTGHTNIGTITSSANTDSVVFAGTVVANGNVAVSTTYTASAEL